MAGVAFITGTRYADGKSRSVFYIGSVQDDGYIYFNDDKFWRLTKDNKILQQFYINKTNWIITSEIQDIKVTGFDVNGIIGGNGAVSPNANVENAVQWAIATAKDPSHGYDLTPGRYWGPDYCCASFIAQAFIEAGFGVGRNAGVSSMVADFQKHGFTYIAGMGNDVSQLVRGDILVKTRDHVELYIGNNQRCGAHVDETGTGYAGQSGDQTGHEISVDPYYVKPWDGILRYSR